MSMNTKLRRRSVLAGAAALPALGLVRPARAAETLVVNSYGGSFEDFMRQQLVPPFALKRGPT